MLVLTRNYMSDQRAYEEAASEKVRSMLQTARAGILVTFWKQHCVPRSALHSWSLKVSDEQPADNNKIVRFPESSTENNHVDTQLPRWSPRGVSTSWNRRTRPRVKSFIHYPLPTLAIRTPGVERGTGWTLPHAAVAREAERGQQRQTLSRFEPISGFSTATKIGSPVDREPTWRFALDSTCGLWLSDLSPLLDEMAVWKALRSLQHQQKTSMRVKDEHIDLSETNHDAHLLGSRHPPHCTGHHEGSEARVPLLQSTAMVSGRRSAALNTRARGPEIPFLGDSTP